MQTIYFGESITRACVVILSFLVIVNFYELFFTSLNYENNENRIRSSDEFKIENWIILFQSILSIFAIMLHNQYTSCAINLIKFLVFGSLMVTLFSDMACTATIAVDLLRERILDMPLEILEINDEAQPTPVPDPSYKYYFLEVTLFLCFVFKLYATLILFHYAGTFIKMIRILDLDNSNDSNLINDNDIGRNTSRPPSPPPQYEQCVPESALPPPYNKV